MTAPTSVAAMLVALGLEPGQRVLEIGTGSGYVTALLARLGGRVLSIERYRSLADGAVVRLELAGVSEAAVRVGDGLSPKLGDQRFDRILVNGAMPSFPAALTSCLAPGGRLVGGLAVDGFPRLLRIDRAIDGALSQEPAGPLRLAPLAAGRAEAL
jgi:protein-L-isoaspartate(D-aspartate) O-methyltransferase